MNISVVISVWKRPIQLELILTELDLQAKENNLKLEVIVSDSNSGRDINDVIVNANSTKNNIKIVHQHTKNIISSKRNFGASIANGEYIIFLDDDCIPSQGFLSSTINEINKYNNNKIVLCGEVRFENSLIENSNYYRYRDSLHPKFENSTYKKMNAWTFVSMNCTISKNAFSENIVSYNEDFIGYGCEDHEFGWQLEKQGYNIIFSNNKIMHHEYGGDIRGYAKKIHSTARDGMYILKKIRPEMFASNKKLVLIEKLFNDHKLLGGFLQSIFFNKLLFNKIVQFLLMTDSNKSLYFPTLFRYILISAYIRGMKERGKTNINELLKNWYI